MDWTTERRVAYAVRIRGTEDRFITSYGSSGGHVIYRVTEGKPELFRSNHSAKQAAKSYSSDTDLTEVLQVISETKHTISEEGEHHEEIP